MAKQKPRAYVLPWPPSVNSYWRHVGRFVKISERGREYRADVIAAVVAARLGRPLTGPLLLRAVFVQPDRRRRDLDNLFKALFDALTHAAAYGDDSQIVHIDARFAPEPAAPGAVRVELVPYEEIA